MHIDESMKSVFFYGLFMDADLLKKKGLNPLDPTLVYATGYGLRIGERATLERSKDERAYGSVMQLPRKELEVLYGEKSVEDYVPNNIVTTDMKGNSREAISYILPMEQVSGSNGEYANSLAITARKIGLPRHYIKEIEAWV